MTYIFLNRPSYNAADTTSKRRRLISDVWIDLVLDLNLEPRVVIGECWERPLHQAGQ